MNKVDVVFLDLNGTLVHDWDASYAGAVACFEACGVAPPSCAEYIDAVSHNGDYLQFYRNREVYIDRHSLFSIFLPAYKACIHTGAQERVFPGVHKTLEVLHERRIEVHIITAAPSGLAFWLIDEIGLHERCAGFHCHVHNKAAQIRAVIDGTDILPSRCLMMGDLPADVLYAKEAGIRGIGFANPDVPRAFFHEVPMDHFVLEFSGLLDLV